MAEESGADRAKRAREARLAEALRRNLALRKAQKRAARGGAQDDRAGLLQGEELETGKPSAEPDPKA